eukprot:scaffold9120_cov151-Isochrysis_galbana.AAC.3
MNGTTATDSDTPQTSGVCIEDGHGSLKGMLGFLGIRPCLEAAAVAGVGRIVWRYVRCPSAKTSTAGGVRCRLRAPPATAPHLCGGVLAFGQRPSSPHTRGGELAALHMVSK